METFKRSHKTLKFSSRSAKTKNHGGGFPAVKRGQETGAHAHAKRQGLCKITEPGKGHGVEKNNNLTFEKKILRKFCAIQQKFLEISQKYIFFSYFFFSVCAFLTSTIISSTVSFNILVYGLIPSKPITSPEKVNWRNWNQRVFSIILI